MDSLKQQLVAQFRLGRHSAHYVDHWERVERYGIYLAAHSGADVELVRLFAIIHDSQRGQEGPDPEHGPRAAQFVQQLDWPLDPQRRQTLMLACHDHEFGKTSSDPTIGTCWDADRLDLDRVGITTDPDLMSTEMGRKLSLCRPLDRQNRCLRA